MKPKYFSQIDGAGVMWYRKLNPDGSGYVRRAGHEYCAQDRPELHTEKSLTNLGYLHCTKREATERGKFPM